VKDEAEVQGGPVAVWDEVAASVFPPALAGTDGRPPDHLLVDFHFQDFQDLFLDDSHSRDLFLDDSHSEDDCHLEVDIPEFRDATLPAGSQNARNLGDSDDNPADRSQVDCTQADSPTSVADS
jgi:hypothetical protein